jgi:uncharacterized protein
VQLSATTAAFLVYDTAVRAALIVFVLALTGCTKAPQCKLAPIVVKEPAFLWKVHKGGDVLWLYGTIHNTGMEDVPRVAIEALEKSVRVVTELGDEEVEPEVFRKYARIEHGPGIDQRLVSGDWYDLRDALRGKIKEADLARAAPWYAMALLTTHMAPQPGPSMDSGLAKRGKQLAMPIEPLETWEEQLSMLAANVTIDDLQEALAVRATMRCEIEALLADYRAGDAERMTIRLVIPRTAEHVLYARNRAWIPKLEAWLPKGGAFVAVGLGHMLGEQGLPVLFEKAGYTVERATTR